MKQKFLITLKSAIISMFLFGCLVNNTQAQVRKTAKKTLSYKIDLVYKYGDTTIMLVIDKGKWGLKKGDQGKIYGTYSADKPGRGQKELGYATIGYLKGDTIGGLVAMYHKEIPDENVMNGDYITFDVDLPVNAYKSIFYDLALQQIIFADLNSKKLYEVSYILDKDSKLLEDSLVKASIADIKEIHNMIKDDAKYASFKTRLTQGIYKGRTALDVMRNVNRTDIIGFLKFVRSYPGKYIGKTWKIAEVFATWVINNTPLNAEQVLDSVNVYASQPVKSLQFLKANRATIVNDEFLRNWASNANDLYKEAKDLEAEKLLATVLKVGTLINDTSGLGYYYYMKSQRPQDKGQYAIALGFSVKASDYFLKAKNYDFYFVTQLRALYLVRQIPDFVTMEKISEQLKKDFITYRSYLSADRYNEQLGKYFTYYGDGLQRKGALNEASAAFTQAATQYDLLKNLTGAVESAAAKEHIANIATLQNNYESAIPVYDTLIMVYQKLDQPLKKAGVLNNKAYALSKMGQYDKSIEIAKTALTTQVKFDDLNNAGYSLSQIGQYLWNLGKFEEAIKSHKLSVNYRKQANNADGAGYSYSKMGSLYTQMGDKIKALLAFDSARYYYKKADAKDMLADVDGNIGNIYLKDNNVPKAITYFLSAYESLKALGLKKEMAAQLYNVADAAFKDQAELSAKYYKQAYDLYKEAGIKDQMLYCLLNLGNLDTRAKNYVSAENYFNQALILSKEINGKREQAITYSKLAEAASMKLDLPDALTKYNQALEIFTELSERSEQQTALLGMSYVNISQGKFTDAESHIRDALSIAAASNNAKGKADAFLALSDLYQLKGDFKAAKGMIDSCFRIYKDLGNVYQIANTHIVAGNYYNHLSDNINAIANYNKADSIYIAEKEPAARFTTLNNIGTIYFYQADYDQALLYFNKANKLLENQQTITDETLLILSNIGEVYYHKKNYVEAEKYLLKAIKYCEERNVVRSKAQTTMVLGKLYFDKADYPKALSNLLNSYNYAKATQENTQLIESSLYLGKVALAQKKDAEAAKYFNEAIVNSDRVGDLKNVWQAMYQRGLIFYNKEQLDSAEVYFKMAINRLEKSVNNIYGGDAAKKLFISDEKKVSLYSTLISTLIKMGKTDEALDYTSRSNTEAIREKLGQIEIKSGDAKKTEALKQKTELARTVNTVQENLDKEIAKPIAEQNKEKIISLQKVQKFAQSQLLNFIDSMVHEYADLKDNFVKNVNPEELRNYKSKILPDMAVLLYVVRENQLIIFTLTKETTKAKLIDISGAELSARIRDFTSILKYPFKDGNVKPLKLRGIEVTNMTQSAASLEETGSSLYQTLIEPIKEDIAGKKTLCIINNGELSSVPFQTIGTKDAKGEFRYLVEDYSIFYTNRLDILSNPDPGRITNASFVAYGNPDKTLPSAEAEVKEINKIMTNAQILVGDMATEDKAKVSLTTKKVIHFATHGIMDYNDFSKTFLKFASSQGNDGKLTIQEIKGLDIEDCDLVTLSACETAVAQDVSKGWFVSPANSFLVNRVKTVVASLWSVDDAATSLLMKSFYTNLKTMEKAQALRKAQETLSQNPKYSHPFYWGAFILYGEWR